jgi:hypothetical protein
MPLPLFYDHSIRFSRTAIIGAITSVDYKWSFRGIERGDPKYNELRKIVGLRAAQRLLWLCKENRGIYIKAGQRTKATFQFSILSAAAAFPRACSSHR